MKAYSVVGVLQDSLSLGGWKKRWSEEDQEETSQREAEAAVPCKLRNDTVPGK